MIVAKFLVKILNFLGHGATTLPGKAALRICPRLPERLSKGVKVICVTGTNGKTTTCALICHALSAEKEKYFCNSSGANMLSGITTAFIQNSSIRGRCMSKFAVLECDENSLPKISKHINVNVLAVTNIFRDQLDRYGEVGITLGKIKQAVKNMPSALLILNGDCPLTASIAANFNNKFLTFGIDKNNNSNIVSDSTNCPFCNHKLQYRSRVFSQLGNFYCKWCGYKRKEPDFLISSVEKGLNNSMSLFVKSPTGSRIMNTKLGGFYNAYNFLCALGVLESIGAKNPNAIQAFGGTFGRMEYFSVGKNKILLMLVKNPVGLSNCIKYVSSLNEKFDLCFALNDNGADGKDISWIWDASFLPLTTKQCFVTTIGTRSLDMALRLKYDGIKADEIINGEDYSLLAEKIENTDRNTIIMSTYTSMMNMRKVFIKRFGGKQFWK